MHPSVMPTRKYVVHCELFSSIAGHQFHEINVIFRFPVYRARNQLAALDFKHHKNRPQATTADGRTR